MSRHAVTKAGKLKRGRAFDRRAKFIKDLAAYYSRHFRNPAPRLPRLLCNPETYVYLKQEPIISNYVALVEVPPIPECRIYEGEK